MKKALILLFIISMLTQAAFSQDDNSSQEKVQETVKAKKEKTVSILINPLLLFSDLLVSDYNYDSSYIYMFDVETQIRLSGYSNLSFSVSLLFAEYNYSTYYYDSYYSITRKDNIFQICFKPMFIHRPFGRGLRGFFLGFYPHITYTSVKDNFNDIYNYFDIGAGMSIGYKWTFRSGFTLQTGFGLGKSFPLSKERYTQLGINADGRLMANSTDIQLLEFKIGYSF